MKVRALVKIKHLSLDEFRELQESTGLPDNQYEKVGYYIRVTAIYGTHFGIQNGSCWPNKMIDHIVPKEYLESGVRVKIRNVTRQHASVLNSKYGFSGSMEHYLGKTIIARSFGETYFRCTSGHAWHMKMIASFPDHVAPLQDTRELSGIPVREEHSSPWWW